MPDQIREVRTSGAGRVGLVGGWVMRRRGQE